MSTPSPSDAEVQLVRAHVVGARIDAAAFDAIVAAWRRDAAPSASFLDHLVALRALDVAAARTIRAVQRGYLKAPLAPLFAGFTAPTPAPALAPALAPATPGLSPSAPAPDLAPPPLPADDAVLGPIPEWNSLGDLPAAPPSPRPAPRRAPARPGARRIDPLALAFAPQPGARVDVFTLREVLSAGPSALVYRARDEQQQRTVVLKLLRRDRPSRERERLLHEARLLARVAHPSVVSVLGSGVHDGQPYLVLEDIFAIGLDEHLAVTGPLPAPTIARIAHSVARGLQAAHAVGVVHGDVKPANLLLYNPDGRVKVADFGLASDGDSLRPDGAATLRGTAAYMAPEHVVGRAPLDPRADMYSLGASLFEAAVGAPPFVRATLLETMRAHLHDPLPPLAERAPGLPLGLAQLIARLLRKRPDERFAAWSEVSDAAEQILRDLESPIADAVNRAVRGDSSPTALKSLYGRS